MQNRLENPRPFHTAWTRQQSKSSVTPYNQFTRQCVGLCRQCLLPTVNPVMLFMHVNSIKYVKIRNIHGLYSTHPQNKNKHINDEKKLFQDFENHEM